ncbi:hypothetical protein NE237_018293 [Protea cynaroides]|uniref:Uncharacterized protein n=1 Tax=Protea cynaroides TaxID=273540 RepID=A0A9Q0K9P6_9MAGN|nr:hypothetical protein NE237_018293 [Protea cynaroides]
MNSLFSLFDTMVAAESLGLGSFLTSPGTQDRIFRRGTEQNRFPMVNGAESPEKKEKKKISPPEPAKTLSIIASAHRKDRLVPLCNEIIQSRSSITESPVSDLFEINERFGWNNEDKGLMLELSAASSLSGMVTGMLPEVETSFSP